MDLAKTLVRSVVRSFYETKHVLVVDALVIHSALRDDDLAYLMNMNTKDLHKLCGRLREDRFLTVHTRPELKEGTTRPVSRTYYFIDYRQTIDAIKWRVYKMDKEMQGVTVPEDERKEYFCDRAGCMAEYTQMEVLDKPSARGFLCHACGSVLKHDPEGKTGGHKQSTLMNNQFRFITDLLPEIDSVVIPESTFDVALRDARPVVRDALHQVVASVAVDPSFHRQAAVKGLTNTGPKSIEVSVTAGDGPTEAEKEAERLRKEKHAHQNALPSWIAQSTISGESFDLAATKQLQQTATNGVSTGVAGVGLVPDAKTEALDAKDHAELDDYFAKLRREQEAEAARKAAALEEEESDDEEEEFEDVVDNGAATTADSSAGATPSAKAPPPPAAPTTAVAPSASLPVPWQSSLKRDSSSGPNSGGDSPNGGTPSSDGRPQKRVKVEEPPAAALASIPTVSAAAGDDGGESDEDIEFEDVTA